MGVLLFMITFIGIGTAIGWFFRASPSLAMLRCGESSGQQTASSAITRRPYEKHEILPEELGNRRWEAHHDLNKNLGFDEQGNLEAIYNHDMGYSVVAFDEGDPNTKSCLLLPTTPKPGFTSSIAAEDSSHPLLKYFFQKLYDFMIDTTPINNTLSGEHHNLVAHMCDDGEMYRAHPLDEEWFSRTIYPFSMIWMTNFEEDRLNKRSWLSKFWKVAVLPSVKQSIKCKATEAAVKFLQKIDTY